MDFNPFLNKLITERNSAVVEDPLVDLLAEMVKAIVRLEAQQETPASETSSAPTTGPAEKLSESSMGTVAARTANLAVSLESCLRAGISDFSSLHSSTSLRTEFQWTDGQTLQVTCSWRTDSGETKAGGRGVASPEGVKCQ